MFTSTLSERIATAHANVSKADALLLTARAKYAARRGDPSAAAQLRAAQRAQYRADVAARAVVRAVVRPARAADAAGR